MLTLALALAAHARPDDTELTVVVHDAAGRPVQSAVVLLPLEGDRHRVNAFDGSWSDDRLYLADGSEVRFPRGRAVELAISAPGLATRELEWVSPGGKRDRLDIDLDRAIDFGDYLAGPTVALTAQHLAELAAPGTGSLEDSAAYGRLFASPGQADDWFDWTRAALAETDSSSTGDDYVQRTYRLHGIRTVAAYEEWSGDEAALVGDPTDALREKIRADRKRVENLARTWATYAAAVGQSPDLAGALCESVSNQPATCPGRATDSVASL